MPIAIQEQINILVQLQAVDSEIHRLKSELAQQPVFQKQLEGEFEKKKAGLKNAEEQLKAAQLKQKEKEMALGGAEEKIKKLQGQLYTLKTNKEYSAMELEIKGLKADKSVLEEEILRLLDEVDTAKSFVAKEKENLAVEEKKFKAEIDQIRSKISQLEAAIKESTEKRNVHLPGADARLLSQYDRILKSRDGLALVPVRKGSCGGCHMELPPQVINEVQMREKIITCESCARLLYWPE